MDKKLKSPLGKVLNFLWMFVPRGKVIAKIYGGIRPYIYSFTKKNILHVIDDTLDFKEQPLSRFKHFVEGLTLVDDKIYKAIEKTLFDSQYLKSRNFLGDREKETKRLEKAIESLTEVLAENGYSSRDIENIVTDINKRRPVRIITRKEQDNINAWFKIGSPETQAMASFFYSHNFIHGKRHYPITKKLIRHRVNMWERECGMSEDEMPMADGLIAKLINEKIAKELPKRSYISYPEDEDYLQYLPGKWAWTVGRIAYIYELNVLKRPDSSSGAYPNSAEKNYIWNKQ